MSSTMVKLEKICDVIRGVTFKPEDLVPPFTENSIVVMRTKNVQVKGLDYEDLISIPLDLIKDQKKVLIDGDLLISSANSWYLVGKTSFFETNKLALPVTAGGFISIIRPKASIKSKYLYHWLTTDKSQHKIRHFGRQTTNISNLDFSQFKKLEIPLPPLAEQQRIADILDKAEAITQKREQALTLCDEFLRATFLDMFGDPVSNPKGWDIYNWEKVIDIKNGKNQKKVAQENGEYAIFGSGGEMGRANDFITPAFSVIIGRKGNINDPILITEPVWNVDTAFGLVPNIEMLLHDYLYLFCVFFDFLRLNKTVTIPSLRMIRYDTR